MIKLEHEVKIVYTYLIRYLEAHGYMPTRKELSKNVGVSGYKVRMALQELEKYKLIKIKRRAARAIQLRGYVVTPIQGFTWDVEENSVVPDKVE